MSDSDDWEKECDDIIEDKKEEKKVNAFADEDQSDDEDEKKRKAEEAAKLKAAAVTGRKKESHGKKDYDKMFEERNKKKGGANKAAVSSNDPKQSAGGKAEDMSKQAESDVVDQLFNTDLDVDSSGLKSKDNYVQFAKQVGAILYEGQTPYNIPEFFKELTRELAKTQTTSDEVKQILDNVSVVYNAKIAEEKKRDLGNKKAKQKKPQISAGKAAEYSRNNNPGMVSDLMGDDDDYYGEEYGDEDYTGGAKMKEPEAEYDFM